MWTITVVFNKTINLYKYFLRKIILKVINFGEWACRERIYIMGWILEVNLKFLFVCLIARCLRGSVRSEVGIRKG